MTGHIDDFRKTRITLGLCAILGMSLLPVRAADNPAQAAARAVLEHKLNQPDAWEPQPLMVMTNLPSVVMAEPSGKAPASAGTASSPVSTRQAVSMPAAPALASASVVPGSALGPSVVTPLVGVCLILSLLVVSGLLLKLRQLKLKLRQFDSRA